MERSESIGQIAKALALAQTKITSAKMSETATITGRDGKAGYAFKYADLERVDAACRPHLSANGIAIMQFAENPTAASLVSVRTMLVHESGEWIAGTISMKAGQETPQAIGSAITYARRYGLAALCGVVQDDDDGEQASRPDPRDAARQRKVPPSAPAASGSGPTKEDVILAIQDWLNIGRSDTAGIIGKLKKGLGINGQASPADFPKFLAKIAELKEKNTGIDVDGKLDLNAVDAALATE